MRALSNISKVIILAIVAAVLIILAIVYGSGSGNKDAALNAAGQGPNATMSTTSTAYIASTKTGTSSPSSASAAAPIVKSPVISIITPVGNDVWKIGTQDVISWSKPGGITGSISLINEANQEFVGVILPQIGPDQTSYTWNTLNVSLNRTDPSGKDITPGIYEIELTYDGNNIKPIMSFPFSIIN